MSIDKDFLELIKQNEGILYKISNLYADSELDREDLRQEMIYQLWRSFKSFKGKSKFQTWMYRVALNTALVYINQKKKRIQQSEIKEEIHGKADEIDTSNEKKIELLYKAIKKLKDLDRAIVALHLDGKNYTEIAELVGITETNVGTKLGRIRLKLKKLLKNTDIWN